MRDPFVTWLDLEIPMENQQKIPVLVDSLLSSSVRETYYVESVNEYSRFALHIWSEKKMVPLSALDAPSKLKTRF